MLCYCFARVSWVPAAWATARESAAPDLILGAFTDLIGLLFAIPLLLAILVLLKTLYREGVLRDRSCV